MAISEGEWGAIRSLVLDLAGGKRGEYLVTSKVKRVDKKKRLIFVKEFGSQGIPIVSFGFQASYYDTNSAGKIVKKSAKVTLALPKVGQSVLIAKEQGVHALPRCLGVVPKASLWVQIPED